MISPPPRVAVGRLSELFAELCPPRRIDLAGAVVLPLALPHAGAYLSWVESDLHGGLGYMTRAPLLRADPTVQRGWARSVLVFGQRYTNGWDAADRSPWEGAAPGRPWTDGVSRYARGLDYHDVLRADVRAIVARLRASIGPFQAHVAVDTGPYLEREYAWLAGLGFFGKNTCLVHERLGSGLFLGVAITSIELVDPPASLPAGAPLWESAPRASGVAASGSGPGSRCGSCRRCQDACPANALETPFVLDANRCLSAWTIERHGRVPAGEQSKQGGLLFGCDICQAVCPWNRKVAREAAPPNPTIAPPGPEYAALAAHAEIDLADLIALGPDAHRRRFRRTPLWRAHADGMRRNALVVAANTGRIDLCEVAARAAREDSHAETRAVAARALLALESAPGAGGAQEAPDSGTESRS